MVLQMLISIHLMLMLIYTHIHTRTYARTISIHLMLMLISAIDNIFKSIKGFQYISC